MRFALLLLIATANAIVGCATQSVSDTELAPPVAGAPADAAAIPAAAGGYQLTKDEQKLDCPKLTGQMRVRIANMRADAAARQTSAAGRTAQALSTPVFGGTKRGIDAEGDLQRDRAKLEAFNKRLAEKKCKTLDLDAELRGETPAAPPAKTTKKTAG